MRNNKIKKGPKHRTRDCTDIDDHPPLFQIDNQGIQQRMRNKKKNKWKREDTGEIPMV
jgi:hypothetical protein